MLATCRDEATPHPDRRIPRQATSKRRGDMQGVIRARVDPVTRAAVTAQRRSFYGMKGGLVYKVTVDLGA